MRFIHPKTPFREKDDVIEASLQGHCRAIRSYPHSTLTLASPVPTSTLTDGGPCINSKIYALWVCPLSGSEVVCANGGLVEVESAEFESAMVSLFR